MGGAMLTTREWAAVILFVTLAAIFFTLPAYRNSVGPHLKRLVALAMAPRIVVVYAGLLLWSAMWVLLASSFSFWDPQLLKDTILVVIAVGFPALFRAVSMSSGSEFIRRVLFESIGVGAILVFYLGLEPFPLGAELLFQSLVGVFAVVQAIAVVKRRFVTRNVAGLLLTLAFLGSFAWTTVRLVDQAPQTDWLSATQSFLLTLWLPLLLFPYCYAVAVFVKIGIPLSRFRRRNSNVPVPRRVRLAFVLGTHFRVSLLSNFNGRYDNVAKATTYRSASRQMRDFRRDLSRRNREEAERIRSFTAMADVVGTDSEGAQLDRREFHETKSALRWIRDCENGQWDRHGGRFWSSPAILNSVISTVIKPPPEQHDFHLEVTDDGQAWRCWRKLPSGYFLAMGGTKADGDSYYQGAIAPSSWPSGPNGWASELRDATLPTDWQKNDASRL
jgi:hypothetical protein